MDPITATVAASAAVGAAKGAGSATGKQILIVLAKRTERLRVARAVTKAAKAEGILVSRRNLVSWLKVPEVRAAIASGERSTLDESVGSLQFEVMPTGPRAELAPARIDQLVRDESLRRMGQADGRVTQTRRLEAFIKSTAQEQRAILADRADEPAFTSALETLHPWRRQAARELAARWSPFRRLVINLAGERDRRALLQQWHTTSPDHLANAPAEGWCWLACVAADYGAQDAALGFIAKAVDSGASASYWWARAGLIVGIGAPEDSARARQLWARSQPKHPIAGAGEAIEQGEYARAEQVLDAWDPESPNDNAIRTILRTVAAAGLGDFNRAIAIGVAASSSQPESSGNLLRTAEALLSRGRHGNSDHAQNDYARALSLAIQARDARRTWFGDSVAPILTAVTAAALANDIDQAWRLTQTAPTGTALAREAKDLRLRRESAILAATTGRLENAESIAGTLGDPFVSHTVEGWKAFDDGRRADAESAWLRAWEVAPDDTSRLQTANALAQLGMRLPNMDLLPSEYDDAITRIRMVHEVMSSADDLSVLRLRAAESEQITMVLAERLASQGQFSDAAEILEAGGKRWNHPLLMQMAAARYQRAASYEKAYGVAAMAISLGGAKWAGRLETLMIQFDSLESQGRFSESLAIARELATLAPANLTVRWALVHSLVREGRLAEAWGALTSEGRAAEPRDPGDARTWIGLAAEFDDSSDFVQRSLEMMARWAHFPDVVATFLIQIYRGLQLHERNVADTDIRELHRATSEFADAHPESQVFQRYTIDEHDVIGSLKSILKEQTTENPEVKGIRERVQRGELPLGLVAEIAGRAYVEACIKTAAGLVYSHLPSMTVNGQAAAVAAFGSHVVVDASAIVTLTSLDPVVASTLIGSFLILETTDAVYRDALSAQQSLNMLSTMAVAWDADQDRPIITETTLDEAQAFADRAGRVVEILSKSERRSWPTLKRFAGSSGGAAWLSALDFAISEQRPFWCDDRILRQLAESEGAQTYGTIDLLAAMEASAALAPPLGLAARGMLVAAYHVDLDFDWDVFTFAAEIADWMPKGAAAALARTQSWRDPDSCVRFANLAISRVASTSPMSIANWTTAAALGLVRIAGGNPRAATDNLGILLSRQFSQPWLRPDTLPFVMQGIRTAVDELPGTDDPLPAFLTKTYAHMAKKYGAPQAKELILMWVMNLSQEDKSTAARVILTSSV